MTPIETEQQYYCLNLTLKRVFLTWFYTHRLLYGASSFQDELWAKKPAEEQFQFGGKYGTQFKTIEELTSFNTEFEKLLDQNGIDSKHKHPLLYLIMFLGEDQEQQSIENNRHNHLQDYAKFLLNLIADSSNHITAMRSNPNYEEVYDEYTTEFFFAKKELVASMSYEDLIVHVPAAKQADNIVKYVRIKFYDDELYVPIDLIISIQSNKSRKLKSLSGAMLSNFELPINLKREVFTYMVSEMLQDHKRHNTDFYQAIIKDDSTLTDFKSIDYKNKKHSISNVLSLVKVGILVSDYLIQHKLFKSKRSIAAFLFKYLALFKAIRVKQDLEIPNDYSELIPFYNKNRVTGETIRNMMKDVGEI